MLGACVFHDDDDDDHTGLAEHQEDSAIQRDSGDTTGRAQSSRRVPQAEFCEQWARAACSDAVVSACQASDAAECRQTQQEFCHSLAPDEVAGPARDTCISAVTAAYRDADLQGEELALVLRFEGACARAVVGGGRAGDDCEVSSDCDVAHGYACVRKADSAPGTCQVPDVVDPGRNCEDDSKVCSDGFFCDGRNCVETLAEGEPCALHEQCGEEGFCADTGECEARRAVNDRCERDIECARGICSELDGERVCTDRVVLSRADPLCANLR